MNIGHLELTIPQRHLMEIFAKTDVKGDYGDQCVRALLTYVRELLSRQGRHSRTLDALLDGTLPRLDFGRYDHIVMCNVYDCSIDTPGVSPESLPLQEYRNSLRYCFPRIFYDLFPDPVRYIAPERNLLVTWEMGYGEKVRNELENVYDDELRAVLSVVYDYIQVCISGCLISYQQFLSRWTYYLLTREWPDKEAFYKEKWSHEKELREAFQRANAHLARENQEYSEALNERFITVADAARAVLRTVYDHDNVDREADAWRKRVAESGVELGEAVTGRQRRKFYPVPKIIRAFQETNRETVTDIQIADAINARAIPKDKLPL